MNLHEMGARAQAVTNKLAVLGEEKKNQGLQAVADLLIKYSEDILKANKMDVDAAREKGVKESLIDRLALNEGRIKSMAEGLQQLITLEDPVGEVTSMKKRPNGLAIGVKRVPLGVIAIIYESRPNVTADAFGLCFKSGNVVILRGGSDAIHSNKKIVEIIREALKSCNLPEDSIQLVTDTSREVAKEMMRLNKYIDVIIPRGGASLIQTVIETSTVPVIETGTGNCHIFVDESADLKNATDIIINAKTQRTGVCNACESLVIHENILQEFIPVITKALKDADVEMRGDDKICALSSDVILAKEEDWGTEYLDLLISMKSVQDIDEAIHHINKYSTKHSEAILTSDYTNSQRFLDEIDAAAVYVNASTRFTDGFEFGFGAEIGISTQKLHARGPMGLKELTTYKYIIYGNGQIR